MYARTQGASAHGLFTVAGEHDRHHGRQGTAGRARRGEARRGEARPGMARQGTAGTARLGLARQGTAGISIKRQAVSRSNHRNKWSI